MSIKRSGDGTALGFTLSDGTVGWWSMFDPNFETIDETLDAQHEAARENAQAKSAYMTQLNNFQINVSAGRSAGLTAPVKPLRKVVSDPTVDDDGTVVAGVASLVAFVPALPDPVHLNIAPGAKVMG